MVYALTPQAASDLSRQIREDRFLKEYLAVIHWQAPGEGGHLPGPAGPQPQDPKDLCGQTPRQRHPAGRPPLPSGGQPPGVLPGVHPAGDRADPSDPGPVLLPGPSPWRGTGSTASTPIPPEWQIALWSHHLAFTHPETGQAMDFRLDPPGEGGLGALLPPVREKDRAGPAPVQTCNVVSRPVPGGGSRLSLEKARTQRVAGVTPAPLL